MKIYVESNFVLELALTQEQQASCDAILTHCESGAADLAIPAYSLIEPYETLIRRHQERKRIKRDLDDQLRQLARTAAFAEQSWRFQDLTGLLTESAVEEYARLDQVRSRLLRTARNIPLETDILSSAAHHQSRHDLSPQDAIVYASVMMDLGNGSQAPSCFLNRNTRDFDDPDIVQELLTRNCKLLPRFDSGLEYIRGRG